MRTKLLERKPVVKLIMDSGAFSAWRLKREVNLKEYTKFLLTHQNWIEQSVCLDVIDPGNPEEAAKQSWLNYKYMRKQGLKPIPVVHNGENFSWIDRYLDDGCDYLGLSSSSIVSATKTDDWYAAAWSRLCDSNGKPIIKAHGFGEGRVPPLVRFPWKSVDSTTWLYSSQRAGTIQFGDTNTRRLGFRNDGFATRGSPDIGRLAGDDKELVASLLEKYGVKADFIDKRDSKSAFMARCYLTCCYYMYLQERVNKLTPILFKENYGFFHAPPNKPGLNLKNEFDLYLVGGTNNYAYIVCAQAKHYKMLTSYFNLMDGSKFSTFLESYIFNPLQTVIKKYPKQYDLLMENMTCPE